MTRVTAFAAPLAALVIWVAVTPAQTDGIHRYMFSGRDPVLVRGHANVRVEVKQHDVSNQIFKSQPTSEHLQLVLDAATGDAAFVNYEYPTPPAPVTPALSASVWVKATRRGVQLRARVVLPKEPDPARPETPLTVPIVGKSYDRTGWDKLTIENVPELLGKHLPAVRALVGREVNTEGAYIDRLVLNVYTGPGPVDVWVDDLDIGPVRAAPAPAPSAPGVPTAQSKGAPLPFPTPAGRARQVEQRGGQLLVDGKEHFFRAIRHTGTPLHVLRAAGFDAVWLPADAPQALVDEAGREGWLVIPSAPPVDEAHVTSGVAGGLLDAFRRKFVASDVLFWDLGGGLTDDQKQRERVQRTVNEVRAADRRRPLGGDLWDGFQAYSQTLDVVGAHRWPLFTSLELSHYGDWLAQRRQLTGIRPVFWTWVQNHVPDGSPVAAAGAGPHAEQIRLISYLAIASGCRGLGFWSDRAMADAEKGRDRLQGIALLNTELDLLDRVMTSVDTIRPAAWIGTSHPHVKAAVIQGQKGLLVLPIWLGPGDQYVPGQGAVSQLKLTVPGVSDGHDPWLITPAGVKYLGNRSKRTTSGTELVIDEFDTVAPVVFTDDQTPRGLVVEWQDHARRYGRLSARWALDLAKASYEKTLEVHKQLDGMGVKVTDGDRLLEKTHEYYAEATKHYHNEVYDRAYQDATRALRPLRLLMRAHWQLAVGTLDIPTASPYAVSYFTLPKHWELARQVQAGRPAGNRLPNGDFELGTEPPVVGVPVASLPGWVARTGSLDSDRVAVAAGLVPAAKIGDKEPEPKKQPDRKGIWAPGRPLPLPEEAYRPTPTLGQTVLKLHVRVEERKDASGKAFRRGRWCG